LAGEFAPYKKDDKLLRGKEGRLFLANDRNQVLNQHTGRLRLTSSLLRSWQVTLENRVARLEKLGIPYFFLMPPNAHSVYPEDLPDEITPAAERPVHQLLSHLREKGSFAHVIYPLDDLLAAKPDPLLYSKGDSHWTSRGALVAWRRLAHELSEVTEVTPIDESALDWLEVSRTGELDYKLEPPRESIDVIAEISQPQALLVHDNEVASFGAMVVTECPDAPPVKCVLFGDSFTGKLLTFAAATFRRLVFAQLQTVDAELVEDETPDVVISVFNERFLTVVPDDVSGETFHQQAQQKLARGIRRPPVTMWPLANSTPT
jgi:alginate O-acetyltransferase complex protein AlgJ